MILTCRSLRRNLIHILAAVAFTIFLLPGGMEATAASSPEGTPDGSFTFYTEPDGARVYISYEKAGEKKSRELLGHSGKAITLDMTRIKKEKSVTIFFEHPGYTMARREIKADYFNHHRRYPEKDSIIMSSAIRNVTFLTSPNGAKIYLVQYSTPGRPDYLGLSGQQIKWDLSRFDMNTRCEFIFQLEGYEELRRKIANAEFNKADQDNFYPGRNDPLRLTPKIPVIIPLYYWAKQHLPAAIGLTLLVIALLITMAVHLRRLREQQKKLARWEAIARTTNQEDPLFGSDFSTYRIVEKVGSGGMARVYKAVPTATFSEHESVAVKIIKYDRDEDEGFLRRFRREMLITSELNHPHILRVVDYGDKEGLLYLIMDLIDGTTLRRRITAQGMDIKSFMHFFAQILRALDYAHGKGVIHRDLKPDNIMVTGDDKIIVMDFGLARGQGHSVITVTGTAFGTPAYMAPEQVTSSRADGKTDQYSLGVLAFQMLTGQLPFYDENTMNIMFKQVNEAPPSPRKIKADIPEAVEKIILQMLEKDPKKRFPDLQKVLEALEKAIKEDQPGE